MEQKHQFGQRVFLIRRPLAFTVAHGMITKVSNDFVVIPGIIRTFYSQTNKSPNDKGEIEESSYGYYGIEIHIADTYYTDISVTEEEIYLTLDDAFEARSKKQEEDETRQNNPNTYKSYPRNGREQLMTCSVI